MSKSTAKPHSGKPSKPEKPYKEFPLFPHATRRWAKKIRGKMHYFGPWEDPDGALAKYLDQKDALHAGRRPRKQGEGLAIGDLANHFLTHKRHLLDTRELSPQFFKEYYATCERLVKTFGRDRPVDDLSPEDFYQLRSKTAERWGPVRLGNEIQRVRSVFKYGFDAGLMEKPLRFGPGFKRPSRKTLRLERAKSGTRMFEADEILAMVQGALIVGKDGPELARAGVQLRAMILLGVNCGFGNTDVATLPLSALDLKRGWVSYPRPKTGVERRAKLWPETVAAIREALANRAAPKSDADAGLVFLTKYGGRWTKVKAERREDGAVKVQCDDSVSKETKKLMRNLGLNGHRSFYALRHTFETIGGDSGDQIAVDHVMGHIGADMPSVYRERIFDDRLTAVAEHVRTWLFGVESKG